MGVMHFLKSDTTESIKVLDHLSNGKKLRILGNFLTLAIK